MWLPTRMRTPPISSLFSVNSASTPRPNHRVDVGLELGAQIRRERDGAFDMRRVAVTIQPDQTLEVTEDSHPVVPPRFESPLHHEPCEGFVEEAVHQAQPIQTPCLSFISLRRSHRLLRAPVTYAESRRALSSARRR